MNPILSIWTKPLETFSYLKQRSVDGKDNNIEYLIAALTTCIAFPALISRMSTFEIPKMLGVMIAMIILPLMGLFIFKYVFSWFIWKMGNILQGKATLPEVQLVVAYSLVPWIIYIVIILVLAIPALGFGKMNSLLIPGSLTSLVISIFTFRNFIYGLSYFNKYTFGYAVLNILIITALFEVLRALITN